MKFFSILDKNTQTQLTILENIYIYIKKKAGIWRNSLR